MPLNLLRIVRSLSRSFQWGWNLADRLAFAEVLATGVPLTASMNEVYQTFGINPQETTTLESYLQDYFGRMLKKLKELDYEKTKSKKQAPKKTPFKKS